MHEYYVRECNKFINFFFKIGFVDYEAQKWFFNIKKEVRM